MTDRHDPDPVEAAPQHTILLECNLDDMTGEALGFALERLLEAGALDAWFAPIYMKKNRPGVLLSVLCAPDDAEQLGEMLLRETTTLGVRRRVCERMVAQRAIDQVETPWGPVRRKIKLLGGRVLAVKPEFDDCASLARAHGVPLADVTDAARAPAPAWQREGPMQEILRSLESLTTSTWLHLGTYDEALEAALAQLEQEALSSRLWQHDASLWQQDAEASADIANRLGWLDLPSSMPAEVDRLRALTDSVRADGIERVILLGMGGSSLAPEVMRALLGRVEGYPDLVVLDTTDPAQIRRIAAEAPLASTLFLVASKSGGTAETANLYAYFRAEMEASVGAEHAGAHFVAITDSGTALEQLAREGEFRDIFLNSPDLGGRFSALSFYGLVPAALFGADVAKLLDKAKQMAAACGPNVPLRQNPGALLGAVMGALAALPDRRRDKLTLLSNGGWTPFGPWVEQLIAESTGKNGVGILPVVGEFLPDEASYGPDRLFVYLRAPQDDNGPLDRRAAQLAALGHPLVALQLADPYDVAGEFFRWEYATAVAGVLLGINAFDQPNVEAAKQAARTALQRYEREHKLPSNGPVLQHGPLSVYGLPLDLSSLPGYLRAFLTQARSGSYVAIMAYIDRRPDYEERLEALRTHLSEVLRVPVTIGFGPRFLHSTGQLHKGGPGNGLFLQITQQDADDLPIPDRSYSFSVLKQAQAMGDLEALRHANRRVMRLDLGADVAAALEELHNDLLAALPWELRDERKTSKDPRG